MKSLERMIELADSAYTMKKRDLGDFACISMRGMRFQVRSWEVEGLGYITAMSMKAMLGLMKMDTMVLTPKSKDVPLFSFDEINVAGKHTIFIELYDTCLNKTDCSPLNDIKAEFASLDDYNPGEHWYDSIRLPVSIYKKTKDSGSCINMSGAFFGKLLDITAGAPDCRPEQKNELNDKYVDGLLENGGPAVDVFIKNFGPEKTKIFLKKYLFSTDINIQ